MHEALQRLAVKTMRGLRFVLFLPPASSIQVLMVSTARTSFGFLAHEPAFDLAQLILTVSNERACRTGTVRRLLAMLVLSRASE